MEVADAFCSPAARVCTITFIDNLRKTEIVEIVPVSSALIWEGWFLYCQRKDKSWGLTDCISFIVMKQNRLTEAFTSDHHFVQAGFVSLISAI